MAKEILGEPELAPVPSYLSQAWGMFRYFLIAAVAGGVMMAAMIYFGFGLVAASGLVAYKLAGAVALVMIVLGAAVSFLNPHTMSWDEIMYRKRLDFAMTYFVNKAQVEADVELLGKTIDNLKASMSDEEWEALKLTNKDILDRTVDRARTKA